MVGKGLHFLDECRTGFQYTVLEPTSVGDRFQHIEDGDVLAKAGFEPMLGARPLKRALQKYLEDPLAEELLRGQYAGDCNLVISSDGEKLTFTFKEKTNKGEVTEKVTN